MNYTYHLVEEQPVIGEVTKRMRVAMTTTDSANQPDYYPKLRTAYQSQIDAMMVQLHAHPRVVFAKEPVMEGDGYHTRCVVANSTNLSQCTDLHRARPLGEFYPTLDFIDYTLERRGVEYLIIHFITIHTFGMDKCDYYIELGHEGLKAGQHDLPGAIRRYNIDNILADL